MSGAGRPRWQPTTVVGGVPAPRQPRLKPVSILLPMMALLCIAFSSLVSALLTFWSAMPADMRSAVILIVVSFSATCAALIFFAQSRGLASVLPLHIQQSLVNMSLLDVSRSIISRVGDIVDGAIVVGLQMDSDQTARAIARLPAGVRRTITRNGVINVVPKPISNLLLPTHIRRRLAVRPPVHPSVPEPSQTPFLAPIVVEVAERRIRNLLQSWIEMYARRNPLLAVHPAMYRVLLCGFATLALLQLRHTRNLPNRLFKAIQMMAFVSALSVSGSSLLLLKGGVPASGQSSTSRQPNSNTKRTRTYAVVAFAAVAAYLAYRRRSPSPKSIKFPRVV
ncbi:Uncharacterized protein PBTT_03019 [Plasmodiophora brassicae]|uniref:Uncharacterized protein n=1 Tax=Plasmodiophora brassicae TaxID=37360 RepID=A0A0G4J6S6_PLABS|nr:hypothetical protein PBRA_003053 [Plasmodiophora brassicae]